MSAKLSRRQLLHAFAAATAAMSAPSLAADAGLHFGPSEPFSFDHLKQQAAQLAAKPYVEAPRPLPATVAEINYEQWGKIRFDPDRALNAQGPGRFPVTFFHLGQWFPKSVRMFAVEGGSAREILYDPGYFDMPADSPARLLPPNAGFAGFRLQEARDGPLDWRRNDWVAFLGAAFFRAIGELAQYGISARGIAVNTVIAEKPEEFPDFTRFYIAEQKGDGATVYALLDGPSLAGAYRFELTRASAVVMEIEASLYLRADIGRFGVAPMSSMFWFSETAKPGSIDWRPEIHDSDGLAMWAGTGERLWRPLNNPLRTMASAFLDRDPKGFGLMQRDRNFDHYTDGVYYDRRPSLWVEPIGSWGAGSVQLIENPTDDEIHDNIVAMWVPAEPARAGQQRDFRYRLHWVADEPYPGPLARCVATRIGNGGQPGQPRPRGVRKFVVEFLGGPLAALPMGVIPEPVLWASRGRFTDYRITEAVPNGVPGHWRTQFDLVADGSDPVDMRLYLKSGDATLTETWLYQYHPVAPVI